MYSRGGLPPFSRSLRSHSTIAAIAAHLSPVNENISLDLTVLHLAVLFWVPRVTGIIMCAVWPCSYLYFDGEVQRSTAATRVSRVRNELRCQGYHMRGSLPQHHTAFFSLPVFPRLRPHWPRGPLCVGAPTSLCSMLLYLDNLHLSFHTVSVQGERKEKESMRRPQG